MASARFRSQKSAAHPPSATLPRAKEAPADGGPAAPAKKKKSGLLSPGTRCVHPQHGVVEVAGIVERDVGGASTPFYELRLVASDGKILVPIAAAERAGLRPIMTEAEADTLLAFMRTRRQGVDSRPFQKRMRIYADMLRSGERLAIAEVLRDMVHSAAGKDLSFGERKLLTQARSMLLTEIAHAKHTTVDAIERELEEAA